MIIEKPDKQSLQYLGIIIIIAIVVCIGLFYYLKWTKIEEKPEEEKPAGVSVEEILKSLSAPGEGEAISEEVQESLSVPSGNDSEVSQDILDSLSPVE